MSPKGCNINQTSLSSPFEPLHSGLTSFMQCLQSSLKPRQRASVDMWDIVWVSPHSHKSLEACPHLLRHALHWPCPVRKWFSRLHWCRGRSNPGCQIVWSRTKTQLTTEANFHSSRHQVVMSMGCVSLHNGCLAVRRSVGGFMMSSCRPQSSWFAALARNLSTVALRRRAGGSIFDKTHNSDSHHSDSCHSDNHHCQKTSKTSSDWPNFPCDWQQASGLVHPVFELSQHSFGGVSAIGFSQLLGFGSV